MDNQDSSLVMDCDEFGDCISFSRFGSVVRSDTHRHTQTDANERFTPAHLVGVSNEYRLN